jgi:hypothetical protein
LITLWGLRNVITYLAVPYKEKDEAKAAGAKWSAEKKMWYVKGDVSAVRKWVPLQKIHPHMTAPHKETPYEKEFRERNPVLTKKESRKAEKQRIRLLNEAALAEKRKARAALDKAKESSK